MKDVIQTVWEVGFYFYFGALTGVETQRQQYIKSATFKSVMFVII